MIDPFEYPDEVLYELSSPDLDMETEDYADFISQEDYFHESEPKKKKSKADKKLKK